MGLLKQIESAKERKEWSSVGYHDREVFVPRQNFEMPPALSESFTLFAPAFGAVLLGYFYVNSLDQKVYKIALNGTITTFKDYSAGVLEPRGVAVDSANGRLFVMMGDTAAQYRVDRFDDLSLDSGATAAASITSHTAWGGMGRYVYSTDEVWWSTVNGSPEGVHKVNGALTTFTTIFDSFDNLNDFEYWPPEDEAYAFPTSGNDKIAQGELDGTSWALIGSGMTGTKSGGLIPPAHKMGTNAYVIVGEQVSGRLDRYTRTGGSRLTWLDMTIAGSAIQLLPVAPRYNYLDDTILFVGHDNGGTGVFGLYEISIQEAAQAEGNLVLIADFAAEGIGGNQATGQGLGIHYSEDPSGLFIDV